MDAYERIAAEAAELARQFWAEIEDHFATERARIEASLHAPTAPQSSPPQQTRGEVAFTFRAAQQPAS